MAGSIDGNGTYLLKTDGKEITVKLSAGKLERGQSVLLSPSEGKIVIINTPGTTEARDLFLYTGDQKGFHFSGNGSPGSSLVTESANLKEGLYKIESAEQIAYLLSQEDTKQISELQFKPEALLVHSSGTAVALDKNALKVTVDALSRGFESELLKSLPDSFLERILDERGALDVDALKLLDEELKKAGTTQISRISESQLEKLAQWINLALDKPQLASTLAQRVPLLLAQEIPLTINQLRTVNPLFQISSEQFFLTDAAFEANAPDILLEKLYNLIGYNRESAGNLENGNLKQALIDLLSRVDLSAPVSAEKLAAELTEGLGKLSTLELGNLHAIVASSAETLSAEIVSSEIPEIQFPFSRQDVAKAIENLIQSVHDKKGHIEFDKQISSIISMISRVSEQQLTTDDKSKLISNLNNLAESLKSIVSENNPVGVISAVRILNLISTSGKTALEILTSSGQKMELPEVLFQRIASLDAQFPIDKNQMFQELQSARTSLNSLIEDAGAKKQSDASMIFGEFNKLSSTLNKLQASFAEAISFLDFPSRISPLSSDSIPDIQLKLIAMRSELLTQASKSLQNMFSTVQDLQLFTEQFRTGRVLSSAEDALLKIGESLARSAQENGDKLMHKLKELVSDFSQLQLDGSSMKDEPALSRHQTAALLQGSSDSTKLNVQNLLNRLESLQLLSSSTSTKFGEQQIISLPVKIGQEWTELQVKLVKEHRTKQVHAAAKNISVYLSVSPSTLGDISVHLDFKPPTQVRLSFQFERPQVKQWFRSQSEGIRNMLTGLGLTPTGMEFQSRRPSAETQKNVNRSKTSVEQGVDLKV